MAAVEAHMGAPVVQHDDQSTPGMHDLEIHYADGRVGAVEVTAAEDEQLAARQAAISREPELRHRGLKHGWLVVLAEGARVKTARTELPGLLSALERAGSLDVDVFTAASFDDEEHLSWVPDHLARAKVQSAKATDLYPAGTIVITAAMSVAWLSTTPDDVVTFVEDFITSRPTDVAKLQRADADERHLFIWSGTHSTGQVELRALGLDVSGLPQRAPRLPEGITHVWVAPQAMRPSRTVTWSAATGWTAPSPPAGG